MPELYQEDDVLPAPAPSLSIGPEQSASFYAACGAALGEQWWGDCRWCGSDCTSPRVCPNGPVTPTSRSSA